MQAVVIFSLRYDRNIEIGFLIKAVHKTTVRKKLLDPSRQSCSAATKDTKPKAQRPRISAGKEENRLPLFPLSVHPFKITAAPPSFLKTGAENRPRAAALPGRRSLRPACYFTAQHQPLLFSVFAHLSLPFSPALM